MTESVKKNYDLILNAIGEDSSREGLLKTPERAAKAMQF
ncbi:MAG TPA: GTP cyclohydrolase I FolE, partial [Flavobacteriaceae bacterium]|nr:GTP cyclohydrolase I FolE [Flavobacteriaceae bacterium]